MTAIRKILVLGGTGRMGSAAAAVFAKAGIQAVVIGRTAAKAAAGRTRAAQRAGLRAATAITCATYEDLERELATVDLVFEAVSEHLAIKRAVLAQIDGLCRPGTIVATATAALSIAELCAGRTAEFRRHFVGIHLCYPPAVVTGCELISHATTDLGVMAVVRDWLTAALGREVVEAADTPGFAGNRVGFRLLNEVAQLAEEHGVAFLDQLVGPHTGRAIAPLATIDLVGWDAHQAIVDRLYAGTHDVARDQFRLPAAMRRGIARGQLGRKTPERGGFYRTQGATQLVLDLATGDYRPLAEAIPVMPPFVDAMKQAIRSGRGYRAAIEILCAAHGHEAELLRRILLGYLSYGLGLVGDVVARPRDIDRIMGFGFLWAPPSVLVDAIGPGRTIVLLERAQLPVPAAVLEAAVHQRALFDEPRLDRAEFFLAA
jgi:3-hydroxyacyl-CoA dehydrogenase